MVGDGGGGGEYGKFLSSRQQPRHPRVALPAPGPPPPLPAKSRAPERILFLGWRRDMDALLLALDEFVPRKSQVWGGWWWRIC